MSLILSGTNGLSDVDGTAATPAIRGTDANTGVFFPAADTVAAAVGGVEGMRLTTTGLGIGTSSPAFKLDLSTSFDGRARQWLAATSFVGNNSNGTGFQLRMPSGTTDGIVFSNGGNSAEWARIDSSGNLLVGTTSAGTYGGIPAALDVVRTAASQGAASFKNFTAGTQTVSIWNATDSGTRYFIEFSDGSARATRGSITSNGTTTSYNTSSDYRLKTDVQPMTGALTKVAALKPCTYKWNANGSDGEGFIAHELAEVVPDAVTGAKDAVDADGKPVYQGIDTSFLVATVVAALQELKAELDTVKAELAAMKGTA